jgi:DNA-binding response OmpR family regulator
MKVLIIEDQKGKASATTHFLSSKGIAYATQTKNGSFNPIESYDLLIVDVSTAASDGSETCKELRRQTNGGPILLLSVLGDPEHKIKGLEAGADDYLAKPYHPEELLARMKALTRLRVSAAQVNPIKKAGEIELNTYKRTATRSGKCIDLTGREFALLDLLISHKNRVLPRAYISEAIWGIDFDRKTNLVDVYIKYLRKKVDFNFSIPHIQTVIGRGYVFKEG